MKIRYVFLSKMVFIKKNRHIVLRDALKQCEEFIDDIKHYYRYWED